MERRRLIAELITDSLTLGNLANQIAREVASVSITDGERYQILNGTLKVAMALIENMIKKTARAENAIQTRGK